MSDSWITRLQRSGNRFATRLYRVTKGFLGGRSRGLPVLLLTVAGRKSGTLHTVPVNFLTHEDDLLVMGSNSGSDDDPQWFKNLQVAQTAQVQHRKEILNVAVRIPGPEERDQLWADVVAPAKRFELYALRTDRVIPIAVLTPAE